ncbi:DUF6282 family protein, partial [Pseudomonas syringae group genomosp. 7]|uniref:DUF6282 family protein n=1 Tax=Pseudomonas syringae group genomosp. 7 TaxID=251699 RepID=UPI00376FCFDD
MARNFRHPLRQDKPIKPARATAPIGRLTPQALDIIKIAREKPLLISPGQAHAYEVRALLHHAVRIGLPRLMLN